MENKSIGLYIHIPFCIKKCNYCDFCSYPNMEEYWDKYVYAVSDELVLKSPEFESYIVGSVFVGGGTPSLLPPEYIARIFEIVHKYYKISDVCEISIESNPGTITEEKFRVYRSIGINRLSIGLQACQEHLLKNLGRIHTYKDFITAVDLAQKHGLTNINADIIFGIPGQTFKDWEKTLSNITSLGLTHISCYDLIIEEGTLFGEMQEKGILREMDHDLNRQMYHFAIDYFSSKGYEQYEISNFAKPGYQCRHNMNYWERGEYIGIGAGAHSFSGNRRYANIQNVEEYIEGVETGDLKLSEDSCLTTEEALAEKMILGLRMNKGVDLGIVSKEFGIDVESKYKKSIEILSEEDLITLKGKVLCLTNKGLDLANKVFVEFL